MEVTAQAQHAVEVCPEEEAACEDEGAVSIEDLLQSAIEPSSASARSHDTSVATGSRLLQTATASTSGTCNTSSPSRAAAPQPASRHVSETRQPLHNQQLLPKQLLPSQAIYQSSFYSATESVPGSHEQLPAVVLPMAGTALVFGLDLPSQTEGRTGIVTEEVTASPGRTITLANGVGIFDHSSDSHAAITPGNSSRVLPVVQPSASHHRPPIRGGSLTTDRMMRMVSNRASTSNTGTSVLDASNRAWNQRPVRPDESPALQRNPPARGASLSSVSRLAQRDLPAGGARLAMHVSGTRQQFGLQPQRPYYCSSTTASVAHHSPNRSQESAWNSSNCSEDSCGRALAKPASGVSRNSLASDSCRIRSSFDAGEGRVRSSIDEGSTGLHRVIKQMVLSDGAAFKRVQASLRGITSLAKETDKLEMARDASGATCMNQYIVIKTLGRGSFGKVRLCLNTLDGQLRAIKMVNRAFVLRQLQRAPRGLRRRTTRATGNGGPVSNTPSRTMSLAHPGLAADALPYRHSLDEPSATAPSLPGGPNRASADAAGPLEGVMREIAVLKRLDHPNVVKLLEIIDPATSPYIMLVMEYMEGGPIMETKVQGKFECDSFAEEVALGYFRQICLGLDYLHYNHVVHGDLKPENLLTTTDGIVKISDFGSSRIINDERASSKLSSTPAFQPPEAVRGDAVVENPFAADVWSLGICLYCFIYGRLPFHGSCSLDVSKAIMEQDVLYPSSTLVTPQLRDLFARMLQKNPADRITLEDVMVHPWTTSHGIYPLRSLKYQLSPPAVIQPSRLQAMDAIDHSPLVSMMRAKLKERTFQPGQYLFKEYEPAHCVHMVMSGVVEMVATKPPEGPLLAKLQGTQGDICVELDDSFTLDCPIVPTAAIKNGKLHIDQAAAEDIKKQMSDLLMGRGKEYVAEVHGPGQMLGEVSLGQEPGEEPARHRMSARAKDVVVTVELTEDNLLAALKQACGPDMSNGDALASYESVLLSHQNAVDPYCEVLRSSHLPHSSPTNIQEEVVDAEAELEAEEVEVDVDTL